MWLPSHCPLSESSIPQQSFCQDCWCGFKELLVGRFRKRLLMCKYRMMFKVYRNILSQIGRAIWQSVLHLPDLQPKKLKWRSKPAGVCRKTCALQNWFSFLRIGLNYAYSFQTSFSLWSFFSFNSQSSSGSKNIKHNPWHLAPSSSFQFLWSLQLLPCFSFPFVPVAVNVKPTIKPTTKRVAVIFTLLMVAWMPSLWALTKRPKRWKQRRSTWVTWVGFTAL